MTSLKRSVKVAALSIIRRQSVLRTAILRAAAARGRALVLCYHRIAPVTDQARVIDPIPPECFAEQMRTLRRIGDIVPLRQLIRLGETHRRPVFAITFDDDEQTHVRYALPILRELDIPATFFLSGRSLHGLGPYWWTLLEQSVEEIGVEATARLLGLNGRSMKDLARQCRSLACVKDLSPTTKPPLMKADDIRTLADAGMTFGFHTLGHHPLPLLDENALATALVEGRKALSSVTGTSIEFLAYPYGQADARVAAAARRAGYSAAFVTGDRPIASGSDRLLLSRWQPGPLASDDMRDEVLVRLAR